MLKTEREYFSLMSPSDKDEWQVVAGSQKLQDAVLSSLFANTWKQGHETKEHGERVAVLAWLAGKKIGLSHSRLQDLVLLAKSLDLGKTLISDKIIRKSESLANDEWLEIKMHPMYGYKIATLTPALRHIADGILFHHERWDGRGYLHGLSGSAIPLLSRIVAITDAFDSMTHDRPHRPAMGINDALDELKENAAKQFDPAMVNIMADILAR